MNKRSNFTRTALLSALVCGIAGPSFVGCKDYDDDINALQEQVNTLNTGLEDLKKLVESGKSITDVTPIAGGFKITFSDNTSYEIVNGKEGQQGQEGQPGKAGSVVTVDENGHLWIDDVDKGKVVNDEVAAADVAITIDEDGYICVNGERQEGAKINLTGGSGYAVVKEDLVEFYLPDAQGQMPETPVKVWKNAALAGLMTIPMNLGYVAENGLLFPTIYGVDKDGNYVRLYAGKADLKYEINPKSADLKVNGFVKQQVVSRAAQNGFMISDENVADGFLTLKAKAMEGLCSYNYLDDVAEQDSYMLRYDMSKIDADNGIIDPLMNIIALSVTSQQSETLISDYVLAYDYNISVNDVTIEKKVVGADEKVTYEPLYNTLDEAKKGTPNFTLVYNNAEGSLDLANEIAAFFTREGLSGVEGKFELTANGFDEHSYTYKKEVFLFEDNDGNEEDYGSYVNLSEDGVLTIVEAEDERGSSLGRTPIVSITMKSDADVNHGQTVKTVYAKVIIAEKEIAQDELNYTEEVNYTLNNKGAAQYLQMDKLYGFVADNLDILGADKFHATYDFRQIMDDPKMDTEIKLALTTTTEGKNEWLAVYVPNYKQAETYTVKGVFESDNADVYPPVYVTYTVNVVYPDYTLLTKRTDVADGGNFWDNDMLMVNGVYVQGTDGKYVFNMGGKIANAFKYSLPNDEDPWSVAWEGDAKNEARANIQYQFVNPLDEPYATIDEGATSKENWLGEISITKIMENKGYRDIEVQPYVWYNLDLTKMVNGEAGTPAENITMTDDLTEKYGEPFTIRFISPLEGLIAQGGTLDKNNTTIDQTLNIKNSVVVKGKDGSKSDAVLYEKGAFGNVTVAAGVTQDAGSVYQIGQPVFEWADEATKQFVSDMIQRGGKCELDEETGVITFKATGEVGAVDLKVKVSMSSPWRVLETVVTVSVQ